ncbi:MAG: MarR family winged helix-turn-helix transcriptional regulator [Streptosporangiaceae bacterium]
MRILATSVTTYSDLVLSDLVTVEGDGVVTALHQATHVTLQVLAAGLARLDLTGSEQNVLAVLADGRPRAVGELAAETGTRPTTLTSVLDRLERKGLIVRELNPADRRSFRIALTAAGRRTATTVQAAVRELEQTALASVSTRDLAGFREVTRALTEMHR